MISWLIDKSALARLGASPDGSEWASRIERGLVAISTVTRLEVGHSARSATDLARALELPPVAAMPVEYLTPTGDDRHSSADSSRQRRSRPGSPLTPWTEER